MKINQLLTAACVLLSATGIRAQVIQAKPGNNKISTFQDRIRQEPRIADYSVDPKRGTPEFIRFNEVASFDISQADEMINRFLPVRKNVDNLARIKNDAAYGNIEVIRYQQYFKGIKVEHGNYIVTAKDNQLSFMTGEFYTIDADQPIVPVISEATAFARALQAVNATRYIWQTADSALEYGKHPAAELVFADNVMQSKGQRLAYKFDIYAVQPLGRVRVYVDAATGEIILKDAIIKHTSMGNPPPVGLQQPNLSSAPQTVNNTELVNISASAATRYTGTRTVTTDQVSAGVYRLRETDRTSTANNMGSFIQTFNCKAVATYTTAVDFTDADNNWTAAEYNNAAKDNAALDAHWGAEKVIDYWWNIHGRRSIDNKGYGIKSYVHYDVAYDNAYWNGNVMTYGDGSGTGLGGFDVLTSIDVCAHEIGHGLCEFTANLVYSNESGAMNEGFSDIWAACVENYTISIGDVPVGDNKEPFKIGEEIVASAAQPLRSMSNPNSTTTWGQQPDTYLGTFWYSGTADNGGVHTNSGVLNHWFYVMVQGESGTNDIGSVYNVTGIGWTKAEKIAYVTELNLAANATYSACRTAAINAAITLYGRCSPEHIAVTNAWYAVGVGAQYGSCTSTSTVQFALATDKAFEAAGKGDCSYPGGATKTHTINAVITLSNVSSVSQNTTATLTLGGTASQGVDYTISPSVVTWAPNTSGSKDITITIIDDNNSEPDETIILGYTLNANGGTATAGSFNQTQTITIADDDTAAGTYIYDRILGDFDTYSATTSNVSPFRGTTSRKKIQYLYTANEMLRAGLKPGNISHLFLYIVGTATTTTFTNLNIQLGTTAAANLNSAFATFTTSSTVYSANYTTPAAENFYDFPLATPLYWDGTSNIVLQLCYDGSSGTGAANSYMSAASPTGSTNIATRYLTATTGASLCGNTGGTTATTRIDIALGMSSVIQNTVNLSRTAYLGPNADVYFYSASDGKLMARIRNTTAFDYGCTQVLVDRAGTGGTVFWRNGTANYLTNKSFRVLPTTDNPSGTYDITLYYTKAEHDGWEAATGKDWEAVSKIIKIKGHDISEVTPSTVALFSSVDIVSSPTRGTLLSDYQITGSFGSGFSGYAIGDPGLNPLPIKLVSFTGVKNNNTSLLTWVTSFEQNNDRFEIEVSTDGVTYKKIGTVASRGNSTNDQKYNFTDLLPGDGMNYYRLKQVDKDGQFSYSDIVKLDFDLGRFMRVSPNPANEWINVVMGKPYPGTMFRIYSFDGKLVQTEKQTTLSRSQAIHVASLAPGTYLLEATIGGQKFTQRFVKQ
ncbi:MAG: M4 family metallopeptidase [Ferruginibacter sp.]